MVRAGGQSFGLVDVALAANLEMRAELGADEAERLFMGPAVLFAVAAVAVVTSQSIQVVHAAHEMDDGVGQLAAGRQVAGGAIRSDRRQRMAGGPGLGRCELARGGLCGGFVTSRFGRWLLFVGA